MGKKIKLTQKQLEEALDVFVNKKGNENAEQALKRTQKETEQQNDKPLFCIVVDTCRLILE